MIPLNPPRPPIPIYDCLGQYSLGGLLDDVALRAPRDLVVFRRPLNVGRHRVAAVASAGLAVAAVAAAHPGKAGQLQPKRLLLKNGEIRVKL